jgi:hypothetical protein
MQLIHYDLGNQVQVEQHEYLRHYRCCHVWNTAAVPLFVADSDNNSKQSMHPHSLRPMKPNPSRTIAMTT